MNKLNTELKLLKLNNKLKKVIFRENNLQGLFEQVCNIIPHKDIYDSAWIISNRDSTIYHSNKKHKTLSNDEYSNCYNFILNKSKDDKLTNDTRTECKTCSVGCNNCESFIISTPLIYKDFNFGIITISVNNNNIDFKSLHYELLKDLSDDIAYQAYIINTEIKLKSKKEELLDSDMRFQTIANLHNGSITIFDFNYELLFASSNTILVLDKLGSSLPLNLHDVINSHEIKKLDKNLELLKSGKVSVVTLEHDFTTILGYPLILKTRSSILRSNNTELVLSIIEDITKNTKHFLMMNIQIVITLF